MNIDVTTLAPTQIYHLMTQTVIPRPIAWVLTDSGQQSLNLAPFSYFTAISSQPPLLMILVGKKSTGVVKDTTRNALETGKLVIHIADVDLAQQVTASSAPLAHGESEIALTGVGLTEFEGFELPRVASCPVAFGCALYEVKEIGDTPQSLIFAQIEQIYIRQEVIDERTDRLKVDALKVNPLSRLGGSEYATLERTFSIKRPE